LALLEPRAQQEEEVEVVREIRLMRREGVLFHWLLKKPRQE